MDMAELRHLSTGELRTGEPMRKHTSWRAGGIAARAYFPADLDDLAAFVRTLDPAEPVCFVGLGSNLLVRDGGMDGTVVFTHGGLKSIELESTGDDAPLVYAQAGVASPKVARFACTHGLRGAEFLAGIPGTLGGALAMNAGCYGSETWDVVQDVITLSRDGVLRTRVRDEYEVGYRHVALRTPAVYEEFFVAARLRLRAGDGEEGRRLIRRLLETRIASQPLDQPNAGSVFRNPPGDHAARLIESCGLKGYTIGGAQVSRKHANFIVNLGGASAKDIERLIGHVQAEVAARCGVRLEREVRIVGREPTR
ncbi:MAG: UDP-N-acetylmuramate dehydrogenase [Burkholderiales bacterium]|nr:UDP-N-acetylmuramate dehydrogenase [Burkholderiales bacterium]